MDFQAPNKMIAAMCKDLKRQCKGAIMYCQLIEKCDLLKMYDYFDYLDNVKLQEKVFVFNMLYFDPGFCENLSHLKIKFGCNN